MRSRRCATLRERLATLTHRPTWLAVQAERAVSRALGGSCSMPLAAHATWHGDALVLEAALGDPQAAPASALLRARVEARWSTTTPQPRALGERAAQSAARAGRWRASWRAAER